MKYLIVITTFFLTLFSCKSQKPIVLDDYSGPRLIFGSGGGFTGASNEYCLLPTGEVYVKGTGMKTFSPTKGIDKKVASQMIQNYNHLGIGDMMVDDPGNLTYWINYEENGQVKKARWGGSTQEVSVELKKYFMTLKGLVKGSSYPTR